MNEAHHSQKLSAYCNQELTPDERQQVADHILRCERCRAEYETIKFGVALAQNLSRASAPPEMWDKIRGSLAGQKQKESFAPSRLAFVLSWQRITAVCVAAVIGLGLIWLAMIQTRKHEEPIAYDKRNQIQTKPDNSANLPSWQVQRLAGTPQAGQQMISGTGNLIVGQYLETDSNSRARIEVANIGLVEVAPNSRVKLVETQATQHRLELDKGSLHAQISAPPRLFIVDTPSAAAVDLGCEYTLDVDDDGNSTLHVTSGYVALERDGRASIVPAGAGCHTRRGAGVGTPYFDDASPALREALTAFDFRRGGTDALKIVIAEARAYDTLSLWNLLPRATGADRELVYDALVAFAPPPAGVTRAGILRLDQTMLDKWKIEFENLWFD